MWQLNTVRELLKYYKHIFVFVEDWFCLKLFDFWLFLKKTFFPAVPCLEKTEEGRNEQRKKIYYKQNKSKEEYVG